jgi:predicted nucleic acid-binding protein
MASLGRPFVLDTNCFVDASRTKADADAFAEFCAWAAPRLHLSTVVAAELRAGARRARDRKKLEQQVLSPYVRRGRLINPSPTVWAETGTTLAMLVERDGLLLREVRRSFVFDILIARAAPVLSTSRRERRDSGAASGAVEDMCGAG